MTLRAFGESGVCALNFTLVVAISASAGNAFANSQQLSQATDPPAEIFNYWEQVEAYSWKEKEGSPPTEKTHYPAKKPNSNYYLIRKFDDTSIQTNVLGSKKSDGDCYHTNLEILGRTDTNSYRNYLGNTSNLSLVDNRLSVTTKHPSSGVVWERIYERSSNPDAAKKNWRTAATKGGLQANRFSVFGE